jgi:glutamate racemase
LAPTAGNALIRIGLFDSGVGGLSVLRRLQHFAALNSTYAFEFVYLGDTARCPYGNREAGEIREFISQIAAFLAQQDVHHLVMACNTSAAIGLNHARQVSAVPVHDLISPTAKFVAANYRKVGVMATQSTVRSGAFSKKILYHAPQCQVFEVACPKLVPLVEAGRLSGDEVKAALVEYTSKLEEWEVEAIILGCTHFPFMASAIRDLLPKGVSLIDPADLLARQMIFDLSLGIDPLTFMDMEQSTEIFPFENNTKFFTTGSAHAFAQSAGVCLANGQQWTVPSTCIERLPLERLRSTVLSADDMLDKAMPSNVVPIQSTKNMPESKSVAP